MISFCAGIAEMHFGITTVLSALSALLWNSILVYMGYALGDNWEAIGNYLSTYSRIVTILVTAGVLIWAAYAWIRWRKKKSGTASGGTAA